VSLSDLPLLQRLKQRKIVQRGLAYLAGAFVVFQGVEVMAEPWGISPGVQRGIHIVLLMGFLITLVFAWYHGEEGRQQASGPELLMVAALLVLAGVALSILGDPEDPPGLAFSREGDDRPGVAVLPCTNMSADPNDEYLAKSLHDEILLKLQKISSLFSIGRSSVLRYAEDPPATQQIAAELGVGFVGECSVQKSGSQIRLIFQLLDGNTAGQLWAEDFDQTLTSSNLFDILRQIAQEVALALNAELTPAEQARISVVPTENTEAYGLYLQSWDYFNRGLLEAGGGNHSIAQHLLERATKLDPTFALAFAQLSMVVGTKWRFGIDRSVDGLMTQHAAADSALALQPDLPEAHQSAGWVHYNKRDFRQALNEYAIALEGAPNDVITIRLIGYAHRQLGNWPEVYAAFERASQVDPRNVNVFDDLGGATFEVTHRYSEAVEAYSRALELAPDNVNAAWSKGMVYCSWEDQLDTLRALVNGTPDMDGWDHWELKMLERDGKGALALFPSGPDSVFVSQYLVETKSLKSGWMQRIRGDERAAQAAFDSARVLLEQWEGEHPDDPRVRAGLGYAYAGLGRSSDAADRAERYLEAYLGDALDELEAAKEATLILASAGLADEALALLEPQLVGPSRTNFCDAKYGWYFDPIRDDPRFQALLEKYADGAKN
jgi:TolB-like protein/Flp pilus assembly protein TadD